MKKSLLIAVTTLALLSPLSSHASNEVQGRVVYAGTYGNGDVYVMLDVVISEGGCPNQRFDIPAQNPAAKNVLSTAYFAMASGKSIRVATVGCFGGFPTFDSSRNSYFLVDS